MMKRKTLGGLLLLNSIFGVSLFCGEVSAQTGDLVQTYNVTFGINLSQLDQTTQELAAQLRQKPDATKEAELKKLVEESFNKRHAAQVAEAKALAEKLAKLQEVLKKREDKKSEIVARRVKQLLGEADDLDWNLTPNAPPLPSTRMGSNFNINGSPLLAPQYPPETHSNPPGFGIPLQSNPIGLAPVKSKTKKGGGPSINTPMSSNDVQTSPNPLPPVPDDPSIIGYRDRNPPAAFEVQSASNAEPSGGGLIIERIIGSQQPSQQRVVLVESSNAKNPEEDVKILVLRLELEQKNLKVLEDRLQSLEKASAGVPKSVYQSDLHEQRMQVERQQTEVQIAARRLEIAKEQQKRTKTSMPESRIINPPTSTSGDFGSTRRNPPEATPGVNPPSDDVIILNLQLELAKKVLKEAEDTLKQYEKSGAAGAIPQSKLTEARFQVEKQRVEMQIAARRLEIAKEQKKAANTSGPQSRSNIPSTSASDESVQSSTDSLEAIPVPNPGSSIPLAEPSPGSPQPIAVPARQVDPPAARRVPVPPVAIDPPRRP